MALELDVSGVYALEEEIHAQTAQQETVRTF